MREIKFRVWYAGKMIPQIGVDMEGHPIVNDPHHGASLLPSPYALMQYTGLRPNGVEIYEGDVVHALFNNGEETTGPVTWDVKNAIFSIPDSNDDDYLHCLNGIETIEVIGNIYENPELLK